MTDPIQLKRIRSITFSLSGETGGPRVAEVVLNRSGGGAAVIKIGRDIRSHLPLSSDSISRMHAVIEVDRDNTVTVIDLGSGTKVDGKAINKADIKVGTIVEMGHVTLVILSLHLEPVPAPEPKVEIPKPQVPTSERFVPPQPRDRPGARDLPRERAPGGPLHPLLRRRPRGGPAHDREAGPPRPTDRTRGAGIAISPR